MDRFQIIQMIVTTISILHLTLIMLQYLIYKYQCKINQLLNDRIDILNTAIDILFNKLKDSKRK